MPSQDQEKHERLGTLGSASTKKADEKQGLSSRFRPKNFAKPEGLPTSDAVKVVKRETVDEGSKPSVPRRARQAMSHRRKETGQDQVVFGGAIGAASKPSRKAASAAKISGESMTQEKSGQKSASRASEATASLPHVEVKEEEMYVSDSPSSDEEGDADNVYRPTTVVCPNYMPRSIQDIDSAAHGQASDYIAHMFEDVGGDNLMLFQIPEKLPIFKTGDNSGEQSCSNISDLQNRFLGKLLITKSGKVKMKIGDIVFDVTKGVECLERQELALVDKMQSKLVTLGAIHDRITVSPDISTLLLDE